MQCQPQERAESRSETERVESAWATDCDSVPAYSLETRCDCHCTRLASCDIVVLFNCSQAAVQEEVLTSRSTLIESSGRASHSLEPILAHMFYRHQIPRSFGRAKRRSGLLFTTFSRVLGQPCEGILILCLASRALRELRTSAVS